MKRIAVLTSGGDAPGMNAAIRALSGIERDGARSIEKTDRALGILKEFLPRADKVLA